MTNSIETINFQDADSAMEATAIVRTIGRTIGLSTFVVDGGECEIYMNMEVCKKLHAALATAIDSVSKISQD